jgi:hypothetical protein
MTTPENRAARKEKVVSKKAEVKAARGAAVAGY